MILLHFNVTPVIKYFAANATLINIQKLFQTQHPHVKSAKKCLNPRGTVEGKKETNTDQNTLSRQQRLTSIWSPVCIIYIYFWENHWVFSQTSHEYLRSFFPSLNDDPGLFSIKNAPYKHYIYMALGWHVYNHVVWNLLYCKKARRICHTYIWAFFTVSEFMLSERTFIW